MTGLHIAYISFEYPPDTAAGGIATYVRQAAHTMSGRGHSVKVFCASPHRTGTEDDAGVTVHRIHCTDRASFRSDVMTAFESAHRERSFDVIESPEFSADGLYIKRKFPALPLVVKLHTPWFLIGQINNTYLTFAAKARFILSGLLRGRLYPSFWKAPQPSTDPDYQITAIADAIHSPSTALADIVASEWSIERGAIKTVPYMFNPDARLLNIPGTTRHQVITFVGRLEIRKGLVALARALPEVMRRHPDVRVRFVGAVQESPVRGLDMKAYLLRYLSRYGNRITFKTAQPDEMPEIYGETDICVFPSIWENFPNTCLEAMSAARGIVASREGGMRDMLEDCCGGMLIDPLRPREISRALNMLLEDPEQRIKMGMNARAKVLKSYNADRIGALMENEYRQLSGQVPATGQLRVTVILPTYNPDSTRLARTIDALRQQTAPPETWELIIVDNCSNNGVPEKVTGLDGGNFRILRENRPGLTFARLRGVAEAQGDLVLFVDDDNVLDHRYIEETISVFDKYPDIGAIGGKSLPEFPFQPPDWLVHFHYSLALRDFGEKTIVEEWENRYPEYAPIGAGMAVRKYALSGYTRKISRGASVITDRKQSSLSSGGDNDMVLEVIKSGWKTAYFPMLSLLHLIPAERLEIDYLARLCKALSKSWITVLEAHGISPWNKIPRWTVPLRKVKSYLVYRAWQDERRYLQWMGACGTYEGLADDHSCINT